MSVGAIAEVHADGADVREIVELEVPASEECHCVHLAVGDGHESARTHRQDDEAFGALESSGWQRVGGAVLAPFLVGSAVRNWRLGVATGTSGVVVINVLSARRYAWTAIARFGADEGGTFVLAAAETVTT